MPLKKIQLKVIKVVNKSPNLYKKVLLIIKLKKKLNNNRTKYNIWIFYQ